MATALVATDYRVWWVSSDCVTVIAGITDAGVLETLAGFNIDIDFTTGKAITVDIDVALASDTYVYGVDVDLQQTAGYTDTYATAGGLIGVRGDVHVDYVITDVYGVYGNVYIDPAATCTVNDAYGLYGTVTLVGPFTAGAATSEIAAIKGEILAGCSGSYDGRVYGLMLQYDSTIDYDGDTALIYGVTAVGANCDYGMYINNYSPNMTAGILLAGTGAGSPAMTTGIAVVTTVDKGIDFTDATLSQSWDNAFVAIGSGNGSAGDQHSVTATTHYIPLQVNVVSIANPTGVSELSAAMLRFDADTAAQANSSIDVLTIRSDIAVNVYAATCISADLCISDDISVPTATVQGIYVQITGDGEITCPNTVNVLEAVYKQTAGGGGVDNVGAFVCNATDCTISNVLWVKNYGGTVTNGILVDGAFTTGIAVTGTMDKGIDFSGVTPDFGSQEDAFIAIGTYTSAITILDTGATFIPIQVNLSSTGSTAVAGSQVAAARLRVDSDTNDQGNTALSCLQLRMDLAKDVYAATGINGSMNISDDIALPTASLQGIYFQITGAGAVTCPNNPNVMEIGYHQSVGGSGFSSVAQFDVNATGCSIDNIVYVKNFGGTVTNGILVDGAFTTGINIGAGSTTAIAIVNDSPIVLGTTVATAATCMTMEFDATTTGVGSFQMGTSGVAQVLIADPGSAVIPFSVNILHSAGEGNCDDLIAGYQKVAISGDGDAGTTIVGGAYRAYIGTALGTTVASAAYGIQPWAKHDGTGAVTAMSAVSALVDVNTDAFTASTVNAGHFHIEGAATVTGQFDGVMIEVYPDVTCLDSGLAIASDSGAVVASGIRLSGTFGRELMLSSGAYIMTGSADPNGSVTGVDGAIYLRTGTGSVDTVLYTCSGGTTWNALTTT